MSSEKQIDLTDPFTVLSLFHYLCFLSRDVTCIHLFVYSASICGLPEMCQDPMIKIDPSSHHLVMLPCKHVACMTSAIGRERARELLAHRLFIAGLGNGVPFLSTFHWQELSEMLPIHLQGRLGMLSFCVSKKRKWYGEHMAPYVQRSPFNRGYKRGNKRYGF